MKQLGADDKISLFMSELSSNVDWTDTPDSYTFDSMVYLKRATAAVKALKKAKGSSIQFWDVNYDNNRILFDNGDVFDPDKSDFTFSDCLLTVMSDGGCRLIWTIKGTSDQVFSEIFYPIELADEN
jgi:hypothetical protein